MRLPQLLSWPSVNPSWIETNVSSNRPTNTHDTRSAQLKAKAAAEDSMIDTSRFPKFRTTGFKGGCPQIVCKVHTKSVVFGKFIPAHLTFLQCSIKTQYLSGVELQWPIEGVEQVPNSIATCHYAHCMQCRRSTLATSKWNYMCWCVQTEEIVQQHSPRQRFHQDTNISAHLRAIANRVM